jgi:hypothetical protein
VQQDLQVNETKEEHTVVQLLDRSDRAKLKKIGGLAHQSSTE